MSDYLAQLYNSRLAEAILCRIPEGLEGITNILFDIKGTLVKPSEHDLSGDMKAEARLLVRSSYELGIALGIVTAGLPSECYTVFNAFLGQDNNFGGRKESVQIDYGKEKLTLTRYLDVRSERLRFMGTHCNGTYFVFTDENGIYSEIRLITQEQAEKIAEFSKKAKEELSDLMTYAGYNSTDSAAYFIIDLQKSDKDLKTAEKRFRELREKLGMVDSVDILVKEANNRLYFKVPKAVDEKTVNKSHGLELGTSIDLVRNLRYTVQGIAYVADNAWSTNEIDMSKKARIVADIQKNKVNFRTYDGSSMTVPNIGGVEALEMIRHGLEMKQSPELASRSRKAIYEHAREVFGKRPNIESLPIGIRARIIKQARQAGSLRDKDLLDIAESHLPLTIETQFLDQE